MNIDFKEIKNNFYNDCYSDGCSRKYWNMFKNVSQIINEDDILFFYPKYLFVDEQILQLYFVLKNNKFIKAWINEDKQIVVEFFNINKITRVIYECPLGDYGDYKLTFLFEEKVEGITFNSKEDTNERWKYKFDEAISGMAKYFATQKLDKIITI